MEGWSHLQIVDYEQIPFKCKVCHEYRHFAKSCQKKVQQEDGEFQREEWNEVDKKRGEQVKCQLGEYPDKKESF